VKADKIPAQILIEITSFSKTFEGMQKIIEDSESLTGE
jgi:hypothetical protein